MLNRKFTKKDFDAFYPTNEFTFRLNEGNVQIDTLDRMGSLCKAMVGGGCLMLT